MVHFRVITIISLQIPMKISPMDSECPKTPSWAFTAPDLVKISSSYACCHFSFLQALLQARHIAPLAPLNLALSVFPCINSAPRALWKWCKMSNGYPESSPQARRCWAHGGAIWPRPARIKGLSCKRVYQRLTSVGVRFVVPVLNPTLKIPARISKMWQGSPLTHKLCV